MSDVSNLYIFDGFSETEVSFFLLMSQTQFRKAWEVVISVWDESNGCAYYINRGSVRVIGWGKELAVLESGSFFGEIALITDEPRTATVETIEDTELQVFLKDDFLTLLKRWAHSDEMRTEMLRRIMERVKK
jgi:CRP/FNR family cyclic AMP-dependent transcriptional regulator